MNKLQVAEQFRKALQLFVQTLTDEQALEVPFVYPSYEVGKTYTVGERFTYGKNGVGDAQIYNVIQAHTSQEDWEPDSSPSLYVAIGLTPEGHTIWSQPSGGHDAYMKGDVVSFNGQLWVSTVDNNVWQPGVHGWDLKS